MSGQARRGKNRKTTIVAPSRTRLWVGAAAGAAGLMVVLIAALVLLGGSGSTPATAPATGGTIVQGQGGHWTNIAPDRLAQMLQAKDFTMINVKTPYIGEIDGTDLYIPYNQLTTRASELPQAKGARVLVYCRSGAESAIAAQTLLTLGYTNVWNLDGGMNAWQASGRSLVQKNRT
jgi:rhodanese-related sulfurtransferase